MASLYYPLLTASVIGLVMVAMLSIVYASWRNGISPMPASAPVRRTVVHELNRLPDVRTIVDAGSGWGTLSQSIIDQCPGKRVVGIENSLIPLRISRLLARGKVSFIRGNLYVYDYKDTDLVICYLYPGAMKRLDTIFRERLTSGSRIMSICFALPGWEAERITTCKDVYRTKIYIYVYRGQDQKS